MSYSETAARLGNAELQVGLNDAVLSPPSPETFQPVGEIIDIGKSGANAETHSVFNMQSPDGFDEFISGKRTAGEVTVTVNWIKPESDSTFEGFTSDPEAQGYIESLFNSGARRNYRIVVEPGPDEDTSPGYYAFKAIVMGFGDKTFNADKPLQDSFKLKISGKFTWVPAA